MGKKKEKEHSDDTFRGGDCCDHEKEGCGSVHTCDGGGGDC